MNRTEIINILENNIATVEFTKVNGDTRVMSATLMPDILPKATKTDPLSQKKVRAINEEVISCWDVKADGWRGFRVENVLSVAV